MQVCECLNYKQRPSRRIPPKLTPNLKLLTRVGNLFSIRGHMNCALRAVKSINFLLTFFLYLSMKKSDFS